MHRELIELLATHGLTQVAVRRAEQASRPTAGGKYRFVQPLAETLS